ncbi:DJ-1/PfpI family protein [Streptomyces canus]|uniref:DJ-1/PfpI family protein n=1 Tax=Streptomyces canus TaxID=58343 RepID=UPI00225B250A|nr:DJ-1/PfpI family protein [Streptomyces canus]MCX4856146.1 DJ-1/PfpI family protein [Streptomyces canus]WSW38376.1 DJ-1/PfpI family protein [Streptomyces canus]
MSLRIQILMYDGVEEQDAIGPRDVFGHAVQAGGDVKTTLVRPSAPGEVTGFFGTRIVVPTAWDPTDADVLIVPGGGDQLIKDPEVLRDLVRAQEAGVTVAGVCTGVLVLSAAGLTKGRPCTTHHLGKADLAAQGGKVIDARVVDDGNLVTAGGVTSGIDLALWILARELGASVALAVESIMEYEQRGTVWRSS